MSCSTQGSGDSRQWSTVSIQGTVHNVLSKVKWSSSFPSTLNDAFPQLHISWSKLFSLHSVPLCGYVCSSHGMKLRAMLKLVVSIKVLPLCIHEFFQESKVGSCSQILCWECSLLWLQVFDLTCNSCGSCLCSRVLNHMCALHYSMDKMQHKIFNALVWIVMQSAPLGSLWACAQCCFLTELKNPLGVYNKIQVRSFGLLVRAVTDSFTL